MAIWKYVDVLYCIYVCVYVCDVDVYRGLLRWDSWDVGSAVGM